jgi:hypothetical protein
MLLEVGDEVVELDLAGWEQAIHTPPMALASMLHRAVVMAHGSDDVWAATDESVLLEGVLRDAGNQPIRHVLAGAGHDLAEAPDDGIGAFVDDLAARIQPVQLPPVLVAIEAMSEEG